MKTLKIGMLGLGTVGSGFLELVQAQAPQIASRFGVQLKVVGGCVRNPAKYEGRFDFPLSTDWRAALSEADIVVEVMGGLDDAEQAITYALENGKAVVTANKALMATRGADLLSLSQSTGSPLRWEAAVGGGVPIVRILGSYVRSHPIDAIHAVLNGTTNFMLGKIDGGATYAEALAEAQALGFAEADPTSDVDGWDTLYKTCILASMAWDVWVDPSDWTPSGIRAIEPWMMEKAAQEGASIKLVGSAYRTAEGRISIDVSPTWVSQENPLGRLSGPENAVVIESPWVGPLVLKGLGAGAHPTGSAVLSDALDVAVHGKNARDFGWRNERALLASPAVGHRTLVLDRHSGILSAGSPEGAESILLKDLS